MLNVLYPEINWDEIDIVGFDLDGTLYDEFEFIVQAYTAIGDCFKTNLTDHYSALNYMKDQWLEKGSSYNRIFEKTYDKYIKENSVTKKEFIDQSINIFRALQPDLKLNNRNKRLLSHFYKNFDLFLVTDGDYFLQQKKFITLELTEYFKIENTIFTGKLGKDFYKPNTKCLSYMELELDNKKILYIGDRAIDEEFAKAANFEFLEVYNMIPKK